MIVRDENFDARRYSPLVYEEQPELVEGTLAYDDFWDEQDRRCLEGYAPPGMPEITGEHYFYLNMCFIEMLPQGARRKSAGSPYYRELDNRLFKEIRDAKNGTKESKYKPYGLIIGKPRRVGLSWFGAAQIVYEMIFHKANQVGVCAGKQDKADSFYKKVQYLLKHIRKEYRTANLIKNDELLQQGYYKTENKQKEADGLLSQLYIRTMFSDSAGFEGESLSVVIFEEAGLFQNLIKSYKSTQPCFREGAIQFGTPIIYGTGGEIEKGAQGYMTMYQKPEAYNLKKIFIPAYEYYPGDGEVDEKTGIKAPSFFDIRTGLTDQKRALEHIEQEREMARLSKDGFIKHCQNYPIKESDIFVKSTEGLLDTIKLHAQFQCLQEGMMPKSLDYRKGRLEWIYDEKTANLLLRAKNLKEETKIHVKRGSTLKWVDDENGTIERVLGPINRDGFRPDIAGSDSYDEQADENRSSDGATVVYRTFAGPSRAYNLPIAILCERGDSSDDDTFWCNNVKLAIYYDYILLFEYSKIAIEKYFKDVGCEWRLKERPDLRDHLKDSKAKNEYGQRMTPDVKTIGIKLLKQEVSHNVGNIWFESLLGDLMKFGDENTDIAMAFLLVMLYKLEMFGELTEDIEIDSTDVSVLDGMAYYDTDENGELVVRTYVENHDIQIFNPDEDLNYYELEALKRKMNDEKEKIDARRNEIEVVQKNSAEYFIKQELMRQGLIKQE